MNFKQLEAFISVVKHRSFSKAAEMLFITQPTVSSHIQALEKELDCQLISRSTKEASPTEKGIVFFEYAQEIISLCQKAFFAMQSEDVLLSGIIDIATSTIPAQYILPGILASFKKSYPNVSFNIRQCDSKEVADKISHRIVEVGFTGTLEQSEKLCYFPIGIDELVIIAPDTKHFRSFGDSLPEIELLNQPFILRESGSGTRRESESYLLSRGIDPKQLNVAAYVDNNDSLKQFVAEGMGISIISALAAQDMGNRLLIFKNQGNFLKRKLYMAYRTDCSLSPITELFLKFIKNHIEEN